MDREWREREAQFQRDKAERDKAFEKTLTIARQVSPYHHEKA